MSDPTLLVLAAGIGSRYGGFKQIDPLGPGGEIPLDYALYDAWRAGFRRAVLVIRPELEAPIREHLGGHLTGRLDVAFVYQDLGDVPAGFQVPPGRVKPWGTGHAILSARGAVHSPFAVINADDFYGPDSYRVLASFLEAAAPAAVPAEYAMVGFTLARTLSPHGTVSRGVCDVAADGCLRSVTERTRIGQRPNGGGLGYEGSGGVWAPLSGQETVSMNMWGFTPALFPELADRFRAFLEQHGGEAKAEFYIPTVVDELVRAGACRVRVLRSPAQWFGMTYPEDRATVQASLRALVAAGAYPARLWAA